jgi:hypothetical protein
MQKMKLLLGLAICLIHMQGILAQQVYQQSHYGEPGDIFLYNRFRPGALNDEITKAGAGVTWDLSTQAGFNTHANQILEKGEAINQFNFLSICSFGGLSTLECFEVWNETDQAVQLKDTLLLLDFILHDLQRYQTKVPNLLLENFIGFTVELSGTPTQAVIVYQIQDTILQFPVHYADAWTSHTEYGLDLNPAGQNILYHSRQSRITTIDGWGTLQTPYDTFENVLRLRSEILRIDTIVQDDTDTIALVADQIEYMWLDTNYSLPVMTGNGLILPNGDVILNAVEYIYESTCAQPTWTVDPGEDVFYVDETGTAIVNFTIPNQNADSFIWDFGDGQIAESTGGISHVYNAPGVYTVAVQGCMTNCLPLNSCSVQITQFEILDTATSVIRVNGEELGIRIFPNPVKEQLNLFIPASLGEQHFRIFDMAGRQVESGVIPAGQSTISTTAIANGMHTLQLTSTRNEHSPLAYIRFMVSN